VHYLILRIHIASAQPSKETNKSSEFYWTLDGTKLPFPLYAGPVVSKSLYEYSLMLPTDKWIGQFVKYAMKLSDPLAEQIKMDQELIGLQSNHCIA
jgi:hypothetical protein